MTGQHPPVEDDEDLALGAAFREAVGALPEDVWFGLLDTEGFGIVRMSKGGDALEALTMLAEKLRTRQ